MHRFEYLSALGVVQYRRRSLLVVPDASSVATEKTQEALEPQKNASEFQKATIEATIEKPVVSPLSARLSDSVEPVLQAQNQAHLAQEVQVSEGQVSFELLIWRTTKILVLEFSAPGKSPIPERHQLANNVLRAIWPGEFKGADVHQHLWPLTGVDASPQAASQWLASMVSGHLQQGDSVPIWLMGERGLSLLFPESKDLADMIGTSISHQSLGVDLYITPPLSEMLTSSVAKTQTWQLLKKFRAV